MTVHGTNLMEELRALRHGQVAIQRGQQALRVDIAEVRIASGECEAVPGLALNLIGHLQVQIASQTSRIDRFEQRLDDIAGRLDLARA